MTPIPTTGELEELSSVEDLTIIEEIVPDELRSKSQQESRATPLKSLLKKPSFDNAETSSDSDSEDGKVSPKKYIFPAFIPDVMCCQTSKNKIETSNGSLLLTFSNNKKPKGKQF